MNKHTSCNTNALKQRYYSNYEPLQIKQIVSLLESILQYVLQDR